MVDQIEFSIKLYAQYGGVKSAENFSFKILPPCITNFCYGLIAVLKKKMSQKT